MKEARYALIFLMSVIGCGHSVAGTLWQNTNSGMSPQEVEKLYPDTSSPSLVEGKEIGGLKNAVQIDNVKFRVLFYFNSDKLTKVTLQATDASDKTVFEAQSSGVLFLLIRDELVKKYGHPVNSNTTSMGNEVDFLNDRTSIGLNYFYYDIQRGPHFITITYESNAGGDICDYDIPFYNIFLSHCSVPYFIQIKINNQLLNPPRHLASSRSGSIEDFALASSRA